MITFPSTRHNYQAKIWWILLQLEDDKVWSRSLLLIHVHHGNILSLISYSKLTLASVFYGFLVCYLHEHMLIHTQWDTHHPGLISKWTDSFYSMLEGNEFCSKYWWFNCSICLWIPQNWCHMLTKYTKYPWSGTSSQNISHLYHNPQISAHQPLFSLKLWCIDWNRFLRTLVEFMPITVMKVIEVNDRIGWVKKHPRIVLTLTIRVNVEISFKVSISWYC